ncbi:class I SAM-dependent methyltransferase [Saccharospirillum mangrovi]|uniref:class I SAM-dependent methyltransferase n=1 Tax=Saccharospirillum mangrovi TaxID=2161747 RepID=UPI000D34ED3F|nr:class I SAM-dependent methyltransferase [Saccharospirillum mangrovi]
MKPEQIGQAYDRITHLWQSEDFNRNNGIAQHQRALTFFEFGDDKATALDVGCGCNGRLIDWLLAEGFQPEGVDVSAEMIRLSRERYPQLAFYHQDICQWEVPAQYDFITAWDSIWHIPLSEQNAVMTKLIAALNPGGVLIFSCGGTDEASEHTDDFMGPTVLYSSLGVAGFIALLGALDCRIRHFEFDQYPELHAYFIVQKA